MKTIAVLVVLVGVGCGSSQSPRTSSAPPASVEIARPVVVAEPVVVPEGKTQTSPKAGEEPVVGGLSATAAPKLPFACRDVGGMPDPSGGCLGILGLDGLVYQLSASVCDLLAEHDIALMRMEMEGLDGAGEATERRIQQLAAESRAGAARCKRNKPLVRTKNFECYITAESPGEAAQCGDYRVKPAKR